MKEKLKTLVIILLFTSSIFLFSHLWRRNISQYALPEDKEEEISFDILRPYKILLNFKEGDHTILYDDDMLWSLSKPFISKALSNKGDLEHLSREDYLVYLEKKSLVLYFPQNINSYFLGKFLGLDEVRGLREFTDKINYIYIYLDQGEPFVIVTDDEVNYYKLSGFQLDTRAMEAYLAELRKEDLTDYYSINELGPSKSPRYINYDSKIPYPKIKIEDGSSKLLERSRKNSEIFFRRDIDYIKEIVEDQGSILHIYDEEVLKYSRNGLVEYFNPLQTQVKERNMDMSLRRAAEFIGKNISIPNYIYLADLEDIEFKGNLGYRFIFRYNIKGLELLDIDNNYNYMNIDVYNNYIQSYRLKLGEKNNIVYPEEEPKSAYDIIVDYYSLFRKDYEDLGYLDQLEDDQVRSYILESFKDISLFYIRQDLRGERLLIPVWIFKNQDFRYVFDYYSGDLIYRLE